jgi:hypothetical protein
LTGTAADDPGGAGTSRHQFVAKTVANDRLR